MASAHDPESIRSIRVTWDGLPLWPDHAAQFPRCNLRFRAESASLVEALLPIVTALCAGLATRVKQDSSPVTAADNRKAVLYEEGSPLVYADSPISQGFGAARTPSLAE